MNTPGQCTQCRHCESVILMRLGVHTRTELCYRKELLIDGGGSLCSVNRGEGGQCEGGRYFEEKEKRHDV